MPAGTLSQTFRDANIQPGQPLGALVQNVSLVADNTVILLNAKTQFLRLVSDDATPANRTFTLPNGYLDGQLLFIAIVANAAQLADSGNASLSASWDGGPDDTIQLLWDYSSSLWRELSRSAN